MKTLQPVTLPRSGGACQTPPQKLLWKMRAVKALLDLDFVVVCEAPEETVQPVLPSSEGGVLLPSAICHAFQASWQLCA